MLTTKENATLGGTTKVSGKDEVRLGVEAMAAMGLYPAKPARRCVLCRGKSQWLSILDRFCFCCVIERRVDSIRPPAPLQVTLTEETDESRPTLFVKQLTKKTFKVVDGQHKAWDGAELSLEDFSDLTKARTAIFLNGEQLN
jgi:hypothetical protein